MPHYINVGRRGTVATVASMSIMATLALAIAAAPVRAEVGINVFGLSHHFKTNGLSGLHEFNPGLGLVWRLSGGERAALEAAGDIYCDSDGHANYSVSLGGRVHVLGPVELGAHLIDAVSASWNDGTPLLTPYPMLTLRHRGVALNAVYIPELADVNSYATLATFVTVHPWARGAVAAEEARADGGGNALEFTFRRFVSLGGFAGTGLNWRRLFDERLGLRLGVDLSGYLYSTNGRENEGDYSADLLVQYVRRGVARNRVHPYWATGLQAGFSSGNESGSSQAWRTDVGVEYDLGARCALALEYGLTVGYDWVKQTSYDYKQHREGWSFESTGARLALIADLQVGARESAEAPFTAAGGLEILLDSGLTPARFENATFAWMRHQSPKRGWRLAARPTAGRKANTDSHGTAVDDRSYGLDLHVECLHLTPASDGVRPYWGVGPLLGLLYEEYHYGYSDGWTSSGTTRTWRVGVSAVVGVEYELYSGLELLAEYNATVVHERIYMGLDDRELAWRINTNGARLGLAIMY